MVLSQNGSIVHSTLKGDITMSAGRSITKRVAELPSLRYGSIGNNSIECGPLRVSDSFPKEVRRRKSYLSSLSDPQLKVLKTRRVRFDLPSSDSDGGLLDADAVDVVEQTAGYDLHLRTRVTVSQHSDILKQGYVNQLYETRREFANKEDLSDERGVSVTISPASRYRVHPTGRYIRGTLSPTANSASPAAAASPCGIAILRAARDGDDEALRDTLMRSLLVGISEVDLNAIDNSGRTTLSYIASNGSLILLDLILQIPNLDPNRSDNEGNTPLHFAAQAGQVECLNILLSRCKGLEIDARNNLGFTPLMKAALQGRNKCAKVLLFAGANPTLRDGGRGLRADQWARFCGRYVCADVIEKHARQRLLERSTSYGNWGSDNDIGAGVVLGKIVPVPYVAQPEHGIKSRLRKVFRTSSTPGSNVDHSSSARLITQLTTAALCASSPILPSAPRVPPVVKSLIRPLTVPRLQVTLANNNKDEHPNVHITTNGVQNSEIIYENKEIALKHSKIKKKK